MTHKNSLRLSVSALVALALFAMGMQGVGAAARAQRGAPRAGRAATAAAAAPVQIPDTAYPIPASALFVAPNGNDADSGTMSAPFRTVTRALAVAPSGATIVLRSGIYRESFGNVVRPVTIQPYPHEQAWLSGSDVVTDWLPVTGGWVHHNWTAQFCHTCYPSSGAIDSRYPLAGWPDQVFFNGVPLQQVDDRADLTSGTFYVDYTSHDLYVGSDPTVPSLVVEATSRVQVGQFMPTAAGSVVRGIGVRQYGPNFNLNNVPAMLTITAANMRLEKDVLTQSASRAISVTAKHLTFVDSLIVSNGFTGMNAAYSDYLDLERNVFDNNNNQKFFDGFSAVAQAAGVKIAVTQHALVKGNIATNNYGNGIWCDVSSYDVTYVDNFAAYNDRNGLYVEITGTALVASNLSVLNGQGGLKISGGTSTRVYNNTFADNATYQLSVHDDGRNNTNPAQIALGITWNTANNTFVNNILAAPKTGSIGPLVFTEDNDKPVIVEATKMITGMDYDLYTRPTATLPALFAWWIHASPAPTTQYATMAAFQTGTGYEAHGTEVNGYTTSPVFTAPDQGNYTPLAGGPASKTGTPLPADIAAAVGIPSGVAVDRGALIYPGSTTPPPPPTVYVSDTFSRVVTGGWGNADTGGAWGVMPATANWAVNGSAGTVTVASRQTAIAGIAPLRTTNADLAVTFNSTAPVSAQPRWAFIVRAVNGAHQYQARVRVASNGAVLIAMTKVVGTTFSLAGPEVTLPGVTWTPGKALQVRTDAVGTAPTALRIKVWLAGTPEPSAWNVATTDAEPTMQVAGSFGLLGQPQTGSVGVRSDFMFDNLAISST